jgi:UDP-glucose 4-epimerase|tara:strand:- start:48 stop:1025 length:978 start_codon:yes stop_codon:yes gene_type:complete
MKNILLTGGAGYIGSHVAHLLIDKGYAVTVIDSLITGNKYLVPKKAKLEICDIAEIDKISKIIKDNKFDLVMHFAGLIRVDESITHPEKYNNYNYEKAKIFLDTCLDNDLNKIIFSSTASVYGDTTKDNVSEKDMLNPLNPYAQSKLKFENYIIDKSKGGSLKYIILRYFNVAGAEDKLRTGLIAKSSTNLIKVICEVATKKKDTLIINGNDYDTLDGTPIRDFIHVSDLAEMHYLSGKYLTKDKKSEIFNCGYGKGFSIMEVVNNMNKILQRTLPTIIGKRRDKDIKSSIANVQKFKDYFGWEPKFNDLKHILKTSYEWEKKLN